MFLEIKVRYINNFLTKFKISCTHNTLCYIQSTFCTIDIIYMPYIYFIYIISRLSYNLRERKESCEAECCSALVKMRIYRNTLAKV